MKKIVIMLLAAMMLFAFTACDNTTKSPEPFSYQNDFVDVKAADLFNDSYYQTGENTGTAVVVENEALKISNGWANFWTNMDKSVAKLEAGKTYEISFDVDLTNIGEATFQTGFNLSVDKWDVLQAYNSTFTDINKVTMTVKIADDWKTAEVKINDADPTITQVNGTAPEAYTLGTVVIGVYNGSAENYVLIDNFAIKEI